MDMTFLLVGVLAVGLVAYASYYRKTWSILSVGKGEEETPEIYSKFEYLKSNGIRCKVKSEIPPVLAPAPGAGIAASTAPSEEVAKLVVKRRDLEEAQSLLEQFDESALAR